MNETKAFNTKWEITPDEFWAHLQNEDDARLLFADLGLADTIEMVCELKALFLARDTSECYRRVDYLTKLQHAFEDVMNKYIKTKGYDNENYAKVEKATSSQGN